MPNSNNPFDKDPYDLEADDLATLRERREGWYCEYKGQIQAVKKIAKSLSSFANSWGGWLFFGIEGNKDNKPGAFPGIPTESVTEGLGQIRDAARDCVNPTPTYDEWTIDGPCDAVGLPKDHSVIAIEIPQGLDPPYVHTDGRIYCRTGESSHPRPEKDPTTLHQLWQRGRRARSRLAEFITERPRRVTADEHRTTFVQVSILPHRFLSDDRRPLNLDPFAKIMGEAAIGGIAFENVFPATDYLVARHVGVNNPSHLLLTARWYQHGGFQLTIPVNQRDDFPMLKLQPETPDPGFYFLDINQLLVHLSAGITKYRHLEAQHGQLGPFYAKARITGMLRRVPYLDTAKFADYVEEHGLPVIQDDDALAPPELGPDSLLELRREAPPLSDIYEQVVDASGLFATIMQAMGIPRNLVLEDMEDLIDAVHRANKRARVKAHGV